MKQVSEKPVILWQDQGKIDNLKDRLHTLIPLVQAAVDKFYELNLPGSENITLATIIDGSEALIQQHLRSQIPETLEIPGIKLNRERALSLGLVELNGKDKFIEALLIFKTFPDAGYYDFLTLQNRTVIIDSGKWRKFINANSVIADTPENIDFFKKYQDLIGAIESFNDFVSERYNIQFRRRNEFVNPEQWFNITPKGDLVINHKLFQKLTRPRSSRVVPEPVNP